MNTAMVRMSAGAAVPAMRPIAVSPATFLTTAMMAPATDDGQQHDGQSRRDVWHIAPHGRNRVVQGRNVQ